MAPTQINAVVPVDREPRLAVKLTRALKATNGQEFLAGQVAGFTPKSAALLVVGGAGLAFVHGRDDVRPWGEALIEFGKLGVDDDTAIIGFMTGPYSEKLREVKREVDEGKARYAARMKAEAEQAAKDAEEKAAADKLKAEQEAAQAAQLQAEREATAKADKERHDKEAAEVEALKAEGLAKGTADVSNPDVSADAMANKEPAPTPPAPEPGTRRGNRTPRS